MPLLTVEDLREHISTSLSDDALQVIIDANEALINRVLGELGVPLTEIHHQTGYESIILTEHRFNVVDSPPSPTVIMGYGLPGAVTLDPDDFRVEGVAIRRIDWGGNPGIWYDTPIAVTGTLVDNTEERILAMIQLCNLDINYKPGVQSYTVGKRSVTYGSGQQASTLPELKAEVLATYGGTVIPLFA